MMEAKLVVVGGKANMGEVKLRLPMTIGRGRKADLIISHPTVSRIHCELYEVDGALIVRDNGSSNGTYIDDKQVKEAVVEPGHILKIGPLTFRAEYEWAGNAPSLDALAEGRALAATQTMTAEELFGDDEPPSVATTPPKPAKKAEKPAAAKAKPTAEPAKTKSDTKKQADVAAKTPAKQPTAPPPVENDDFNFMADIEFVDDGASAEPVRPAHETIDGTDEVSVDAESPFAPPPAGEEGFDFLDDLDLDQPVDSPAAVDAPEPTAESMASPPTPAATLDDAAFDFLSDLDTSEKSEVPASAEPAAEAESKKLPVAEESAQAEATVEPSIDDVAASLSSITGPATLGSSPEEAAFDFLSDLESPPPSNPSEFPAAEPDESRPVDVAPSIEPEPAFEPEAMFDSEPVAEMEPAAEPEPELISETPPSAAAEIDEPVVSEFALEIDAPQKSETPSFDFLAGPEPAAAEPAEREPEAIAEMPSIDEGTAEASVAEFAVDSDGTKESGAASFDFLDETEVAATEPVADVSEPTAEAAATDDDALFGMLMEEAAPAADAESPAASIAEPAPVAESESPWNFDLEVEPKGETPSPFAPSEPEAAAPAQEESMFPSADEPAPTIEFRVGDDEPAGEPAFAFGPPVEVSPPVASESIEPETIEAESSFSVDEEPAAPIMAAAPSAPSPRPAAAAKKPSFIDKLKMLLGGSTKKAKPPKSKVAAKSKAAPSDEPAAGAGPFVPMFAPSPPADAPIPLADDLLSPSATELPPEPATSAEPAEFAFEAPAAEPLAAPPAIVSTPVEEPEPFDFEAGLFEKTEMPPVDEMPPASFAPAAEPTPEFRFETAETAPAASPAEPDFPAAFDVAAESAPETPAASQAADEFDFGGLFDETPAAPQAEAAAAPPAAAEPDWVQNTLDLTADEPAAELNSPVAEAPQAAAADDLDLTSFFDESAGPMPAVAPESPASESVAAAESSSNGADEPFGSLFNDAPALESAAPPAADSAEALFAAVAEAAPPAESPAEPLVGTAAAEMMSTPVAPARRNPSIDVDARLLSSHRMLARITVRAPRVDVPHMEPEAPAGRNFELHSRSASRVVAREPAVEQSPSTVPSEAAFLAAAETAAPTETPALVPPPEDFDGDALAFFDSDADASDAPPVAEATSPTAEFAFDVPAEEPDAPRETVPPTEDVAASTPSKDDDLDKFLDDLGMG